MGNMIAKTILDQLGGQRFIMMVGAKNLVALSDGIRFQLKRSTFNKGIKDVVIVLDFASDTYVMRFYKNLIKSQLPLKEIKEVYCDMLESVFEQETGLYTRF